MKEDKVGLGKLEAGFFCKSPHVATVVGAVIEYLGGNLGEGVLVGVSGGGGVVDGSLGVDGCHKGLPTVTKEPENRIGGDFWMFGD